jgi:selenocysteine lyase/cysteine desulfurase
VPVDVQRTPVDFMSCGAQKWLLSPWGTGFLYVRKELIEQFTPTFAGWAAYRGTDDYSRLTAYDRRPWPDARRFELLSHAIQDFAAFNASLELLLDLGISAIDARLRSLHQPLRAWAERTGAVITSPDGPRGSAILCIRPRGDLAAAYQHLQDAGVACSMREGAIRLSPHVFNTADELAMVCEVLQAGPG